MDNTPLPNNSHKYRDMQKESKMHNIERVTKGEVKFKKKSAVREFFDNFIQDDGEKIKSYVVGDVLIPSIKNAISDIITNSINILFYGDSGRNRRGTADRVSYRNYSSPSSVYNPNRMATAQPRQNAFMFENVCYNSYAEASDVLDRMYEILSTYGVVSVADLDQLIGISGDYYTDNNYGWTQLNGTNSYIRGGRDGFELNLPRPMPLNNN